MYIWCVGYLVGSNPGIPDGWWYRFLYRSILNAIGLGVSLAGASLFARTSLAIWVTILVCLSSALLSFFVTPPAEVSLIYITQHDIQLQFGIHSQPEALSLNITCSLINFFVFNAMNIKYV